VLAARTAAIRLIAEILWNGLGSWRCLGPAAPFLFGASLALASATLLMVWSRDSKPPGGYAD